MIKTIRLTNEQAITLYNLLSGLQLGRTENRKRWSFLEVIEDKVFEFEERSKNRITEIKEILVKKDTIAQDKNLGVDEKMAKMRDLEAQVKKIDEISKNDQDSSFSFEFTDREVFTFGKEMFEKSGDETDGKKPLTQRLGKIFTQIEDAFMNVKESVKDEKKKPKKK